MAYPIQSIPDRQILVNGKLHLYFGGTSYLGLQNYEPFKTLYLKNVSKYGLHYGASRKSNVQLDIYEEAENYLANWVGGEYCVTMSSGYLAAQLVVHTLLAQGHPVFATPNAHTALLINGVEQARNFEQLLNAVSTATDSKKSPVVLFDTIDFSGKQFPNFQELRKLPLEKIILVGDDSHGIGIVGNHGNGCYQTLKKLKPANLFVCCSLGKALGIQAGAVFGDKAGIENLKNTPFFGGASPASPAFMATLLGAEQIYFGRLQILEENHRYFISLLKNPSFFSHMEGHPTFEFQNIGMATALNKDGFVFTNFNYPNENGHLVSRIVLSAYHNKNDIEKLIRSVNEHVS